MTKLTTVKEILQYLKERQEHLRDCGNQANQRGHRYTWMDCKSQHEALVELDDLICDEIKEEPQTMIKFITDDTKDTQLTYEMVKEYQFFVCRKGHLCQKYRDTPRIIAWNDGSPRADSYADWTESHIIQKILPHVTKIEF